MRSIQEKMTFDAENKLFFIFYVSLKNLFKSKMEKCLLMTGHVNLTKTAFSEHLAYLKILELSVLYFLMTLFSTCLYFRETKRLFFVELPKKLTVLFVLIV